MIVLSATLRARPGRRDDLVRALDAIRRDAEDEPGTLVFTVHTAAADDAVVFCYEAYRDADAMAAHREGAALQTLMAQLDELVDGSPAISYLTLVGATGLTLE